MLQPEQQEHLIWAGWAPDRANAPTGIPPLFSANSGFNLSSVNSGGIVHDDL